MMADLLSRVLLEPRRLEGLSLREWDLVIRQGRKTLLLARLEWICRSEGWLDSVPLQVRHHLEASRRHCERQHREVRWEIDRIRRALASVETPIVLLKGAAYVMAGLPPANGRMFSDIDIMVAHERLPEVEAALALQGWLPQKLDPYDQRYYRTWMHELPPLRQVATGAVLDVHHTITPPTSRGAVDARKLFETVHPVDTARRLFILSPTDLVLHSATHLFQEGEFDHGLRDLVDFDALLRHFGDSAGFWQDLVDRAMELALGRFLYYAIEHARAFLATPVPAPVVAMVDRFRPPRPIRAAMSRLLRVSLRPDHPSCDSRFTGLARWLLFVRGHYLRMPPHLLLPHLLRKGFRRSAA